jgi:hypothetical protein
MRSMEANAEGDWERARWWDDKAYNFELCLMTLGLMGSSIGPIEQGERPS